MSKNFYPSYRVCVWRLSLGVCPCKLKTTLIQAGLEVKNNSYLQNTAAQNQLLLAVKTTFIGELKGTSSIYNQLTLHTGTIHSRSTNILKNTTQIVLSLSRGGLVKGKKIFFLFLKLGANNHFV